MERNVVQFRTVLLMMYADKQLEMQKLQCERHKHVSLTYDDTNHELKNKITYCI
jgi:hypothetical protein